MNLRFSIFDLRALETAFDGRGSLIVLLGCVLSVGELGAQGNSSLLESNLSEMRMQLELQRGSVKALTQSLAESNAEAELFRRKYSDLQLRMEALGVESARSDRTKLEQRLLRAVSDLQVSQKEREQLRDQMLRLSEAMLQLLKTATGGDAEARAEVEAQVRSTNALIAQRGSGTEAPATLMDGSVVSVKDEWSLIVGNFGERHGVKIGMPLRVVRNDRTIATLRVVDVRQKICGAVIQEMDSEKEKIKVGDRLQADARQNVSLK